MKPSDVSPTGEARGSVDLFDEMLADLLERRYIVMDQHGRISRWGSGAETSLGWREEEVSSRCAVSSPLAWCGDGLNDWTTHLQAPRESTPPLRSPLTMLCRDGSGLPIDAIAVQVPLRLGFEFTMLVGDLAVGGPGSLSTERMGQAHRLATDAIAAALSGEPSPPDAVAGLLIAFHETGGRVDLGNPDALHAARALAIEIEAVDRPAASPEPQAEPEAASSVLEELAGAREAMEQVEQLGREVDRMRSQLADESDKARLAGAETERLTVALSEANDRLEEARAALEDEQREREVALAAAAEQASRERDEAAAALEQAIAEHSDAATSLDEATGRAEGIAAELETAVKELEARTAERDELHAKLDAAAAERDEARGELETTAAYLEEAREMLRAAVAEGEELRSAVEMAAGEHGDASAALAAATAEREQLRAERDDAQSALDRAEAALAQAIQERDEALASVNGVTERRRDELAEATRRCEELSAALAEKNAELEALPGQSAVDAAKRDRDEARSALAIAFAERDEAQAALDAAHRERDEAGAALEQAQSDRETRLDELRQRLEEAERSAATRAAEADAARGRASEERERAMDAVRESEALARERSRMTELEMRIEELETELDEALTRAQEHEPPVSTGAPWKRYDPSAGPREFRPGLDDAEVPRAYIGLDGHFAAINAEFCKLVSYPETDFLNAYWPPVVDVDHRESLRRLTRRMMAGELESAEVDTLYMSGNGELVRVVGTISAERDDSGQVVRLVLDASPRATVSG